MRPDPDYIKGLLTAFQDFPEPSMTIEDLEKLGYSHEDKAFYFHMKLFNDQGFVESDDGKPGIGTMGSADGQVVWSVMQLRLTASGHDFAEALNSKSGWQAVKKSAVSSSLGVMKDIAVTALKGELAKHGFIPH